MSALIFLVPLFADEFQTIYDAGVISVDRSRVVLASDDAEGVNRSEVLVQLRGALPEFPLGAEQSVLVLGFSSPAPAPSSGSGERFACARLWFQADECVRIYPLTSRAREIVLGRFGGKITLEKPVFEEIVEDYLQERTAMNRMAGANALVRLLVENQFEFETGSKTGMGGLTGEIASDIRQIVAYERRNPMTAEPVSGLRDLGLLLKNLQSAAAEIPSSLIRLSQWIKPRQEMSGGLCKVYGDPELRNILADLTKELGLPVGADAVAIFMYWRELSIRARGLDVHSLESDCRELSGCVCGSSIIEALWLLGFSVGFVSFATGYYEGLGGGHPFAPGGSPIRKVTLLEIKHPAGKQSCTPATQPEGEPQATPFSVATSRPEDKPPDHDAGAAPSGDRTEAAADISAVPEQADPLQDANNVGSMEPVPQQLVVDEPPHALERQAGDADIPGIASEPGETAPDGAEGEDAVEPEASVDPVVVKSGAARKNPAKSWQKTDEQLGFGGNLQS